MKRFTELIAQCLDQVDELMPWDLVERLDSSPQLLLLDVREPYEFETMHGHGSMNVPRGIIESACEYDYEETVPELVEARDRDIVVICRSGNRSILAAYTMQLMGYNHVQSLRTGLRGWNDYEQPLVDKNGNTVSLEQADDYFFPRLRPSQVKPKSVSRGKRGNIQKSITQIC